MSLLLLFRSGHGTPIVVVHPGGATFAASARARATLAASARPTATFAADDRLSSTLVKGRP